MRTNNYDNFSLPKWVRCLAVLMASLSLIACDNVDLSATSQLSKLEKIKKEGILHVATRLDPTTYYPLPEGGHSGLEYDLVMLFAQHLGVRVKFQVPEKFETILKNTHKGNVDLAASGLTITQKRQQKLRFAPPYHTITEQVIYRAQKPESIADLTTGILEITAGTSHADSLKKLQNTSHPELSWISNNALDTTQLLKLVSDGLIDYTVADSNQVILMRRFYPELKIAFNISEPKALAWALPQSEDDSLYQEVTDFFQRIKKDQTLAQLIERHYGHAEKLSYMDKLKFYRRQHTRLPKYKSYFIENAEKYNLDWRLLAAIGYQESHWEKSAISPTGVKGIMMLTNDTAKDLGVTNRTDPKQSIDGGVLYFHQRLGKFDDEIKDPDRTWFALASYNIGLGHLQDARRLTRKYGKDANKWIDVRPFLLKLKDEEWYNQTRYGQARGGESVIYVENIRNYYDLLIWQNQRQKAQKQAHLKIKKVNFMDQVFENYFTFGSLKFSLENET
ncbi:MAG: membrane-bound lytic murein transglycosylase MltF [Methylococcales bacterium]|nr:membrane-bound lytic murein transglycosylase MltF [Methylococcales bacterium]